MKTFHRAAMILMSLAVVASTISMADARGRLQGKSDAQTVARLGGIVERSGYTYKKAADNVWVVHFTGQAAGDVNVLVTSAEGIVIMGVVVAQKDTMRVTPEMMHRLLKLTHEIDR